MTRTLDAKFDRLDLRDRQYRPPLVAIPSQWPLQKDIVKNFYNYIRARMILDQGEDGACTGFGLAAVINYLLWKDETRSSEKKVSPHMLYRMAKIYDEWDEEDYEGSSCRGAMKGWHRHGVCLERSWKREFPENSDWMIEAPGFTLGAYYRVDKNSVNDMQSAVREVGAVFCSAMIDDGWFECEKKEKTRPPNLLEMLPVIKYGSKGKGGHAFAILGYDNRGFIVQNSWGSRWGYGGFAILSYDDWLKYGSDAWVAVMGVPAKVKHSPRTYTNYSLSSLATGINQKSQKPTAPWDESTAYEHTLVLRNNGFVRASLTDKNADESMHFTCYEKIVKWMKKSDENRKVMIYAHGGLTSEKSNLNRIRTMAPYFMANGIYPLFVTWKTGFLETVTDRLEDGLDKDMAVNRDNLSGSFMGDISKKLQNATDYFLELLCRKVLVTGIWTEIKENAKLANFENLSYSARSQSQNDGGMVLLAKKLQRLKSKYNDCEFHLIGHSAGSVILGYWMSVLKKYELCATSVNLYAPVCTMEFANDHYTDETVLPKDALYIHILDDVLEKEDHVGPYGKSLSYLVSCALEKRKNTPLLGLMSAWTPDEDSDTFRDFCDKESIYNWLEYAGCDVKCLTYAKNLGEVKISLDSNSIPYAHGSFDNDIKVIEDTIRRIKGVDKLDFRVESLRGY